MEGVEGVGVEGVGVEGVEGVGGEEEVPREGGEGCGHRADLLGFRVERSGFGVWGLGFSV